jgi:hypothetical protein
MMNVRSNPAGDDFLTIIRSLMFVVGWVIGAVPASASTVAQYNSAQAAHLSCPHDTVVWLNLPTGIFHFEGERWYGHTRNGAYVCEKQAVKAGDRATQNGQ